MSDTPRNSSDPRRTANSCGCYRLEWTLAMPDSPDRLGNDRASRSQTVRIAFGNHHGGDENDRFGCFGRTLGFHNSNTEGAQVDAEQTVSRNNFAQPVLRARSGSRVPSVETVNESRPGAELTDDDLTLRPQGHDESDDPTHNRPAKQQVDPEHRPMRHVAHSGDCPGKHVTGGENRHHDGHDLGGGP